MKIVAYLSCRAIGKFNIMISYIGKSIPYEMANLIVNDIVNTLAKAKAKTIANNNDNSIGNIMANGTANIWLSNLQTLCPGY